MKYFALVLVFLVPLLTEGQSITIKVTAADSGEPLHYAHAFNQRTKSGRITDEAGRISLEAQRGDTIMVSYVGYQDIIFSVGEDQSDYSVALQIHPMEEVVIFAEEPFNRRAAEGRQDVSMEMLEALPAFNGDPDIIKAITFLPGVAGGKDGYSHLFVRGGDQDENLILLDGAPLYNVNHFGGFVSMFHSDMIQSVNFYKGYWPSRFGGRLSSVMDIRSKSGNFKEHLFSTDLSPISGKAHITGPLWKDKVSYIVGGRRTFIDLLLLRHLTNRTRSGKRSGYSPLFTVLDLNGKIDARIGENQNLSISAFRGSDGVFFVENKNNNSIIEDDEYNILNQNIALNYSYYPNSSTSVKAHFSSSFYRHFFEDKSYNYHFPSTGSPELRGTNYSHTGNSIRTHKAQLYGTTDMGIRWQWNYGIDHETVNYDIYLNRSRKLINHGESTLVDELSIQTGSSPAYISSVFADGLFNVSSKTRIKAGWRIPRYQYEDYTTWMSEPKILISHDVSPNTTLNASYNRQQQFSHLLSYTEAEGYFREFYLTSNRQIPSSLSHQWSLGWFYRFRKNASWLSDANVSVELFYKKQSHLNKFVPGIDPDESVVHYSDHLLTNGKASTYGFEFLFQKTAGKFHTSLSYTYANSRARFNGYNRGRTFNADFDYRHNGNILLIYKFRKGYQMSAQWDYRSGRPFTVSTSYNTRDDIIPGKYPIVTAMNNSRYPAYHRLDLSLDREWRTKRKGIKNWFGISIYNAYNHVNPFYAYPDNGKLHLTGFFPLIPSFHFGLELGNKKNQKK